MLSTGHEDYVSVQMRMLLMMPRSRHPLELPTVAGAKSSEPCFVPRIAFHLGILLEHHFAVCEGLYAGLQVTFLLDIMDEVE